jgi:formylglycine-generating enzyme required for sulfatase activity
MSEKTVQAIEIPSFTKPGEESRVLPLAIAALVCFAISVMLGYGAWYLFGSRNRSKIEQPVVAAVQKTKVSVLEVKPIPTETFAPTPASEMSGQPEANQTDINQPEIEGIVKVEGGEFATGGDASRPWKRSIINDFAIAETEVTNAQYAEFIKETNRAEPSGWKNNTFPDGQENYPVTNVSWRDANAFCSWLAKKLNAEVRLPTEAEWELAATGRDGKKYPWGDEWNKEAANSQESGGRISAVKSFALNRSPSGAFDMVGNVWEWTQDKVINKNDATDKMVEQALEGGQILRVVKGGSAGEKASQIFAQARYQIPETSKAPKVGFRYVVVRKQ